MRLNFALVAHTGYSTNFQEEKLRHSLAREGKGVNEVDEDEIVLHALIKCLLSIPINLISSPVTIPCGGALKSSLHSPLPNPHSRHVLYPFTRS